MYILRTLRTLYGNKQQQTQKKSGLIDISNQNNIFKSKIILKNRSKNEND